MNTSLSPFTCAARNLAAERGVDAGERARQYVRPMEYEFCRICGQTNPLDRPACAMCGRASWRPLATGSAGLLGAMNRVDAAVGRARGVRETSESLQTRRSA